MPLLEFDGPQPPGQITIRDPRSGIRITGLPQSLAPLYRAPAPHPAPSYGSGSYRAPARRSSAHAAPPPKPTRPAPSPFDPYPGPAVDAAKNLVTNFMGWLGNPVGGDAMGMAVELLQNGMQANPAAAYRFLFTHQGGAGAWGVTDITRQAHPWAEFGMDADTFHQKQASTSDMFMNLIGNDPSYVTNYGGSNLNKLYYDTLTLGLAQSDVVARLSNMSDVVAANPWLATGSTFAQAKQQYSSLYGAPPVDHAALGDWFRFNLGSSQLQSGQKELVQSTSSKSVGTQVR